MRTISEPHFVAIEQIAVDLLVEARDWLYDKASEYRLGLMLAHADDGVIWGKLESGDFITSHEVTTGHVEARQVCPPLRTSTLQQARLFAEHAELLLWRDGEGEWQARLIWEADQADEGYHAYGAIDEEQILWGTDPHPLDYGFTLMRDGAQDLLQAVPILVEGQFDESTRPLRLWVRHYLTEDETGFTRIGISRLVSLYLGEISDERPEQGKPSST